MNSFNNTEKGTWKGRRKHNLINLQVIQFEEEGLTILYAPQLALSGYGNSLKEAEDSFNIVLDEFFDYTTQKGTLEKELIRLGWTIEDYKEMVIYPPQNEYLMNKNEEYRNIIHNYPYQIHQRNITIPA